MSAATGTRTLEQSAAILAAAEARNALWLNGNDAIRQAAWGLRDSLDTYRGLESGWVHPASAYPELSRGWPDNALEMALEEAGREASDWAGALVITVREKTGTDLEASCGTERAA